MPDSENPKPPVAASSTFTFGLDLPAASRPPDDHQIYTLVGRVASEWAHLEHVLDKIIWQLAGTPDNRGACITAQIMGVANRIDTIVALLTHESEVDPAFTRLIAKAKALKNKSHDISEQRNRIIHDPWYVIPDLGAVAQLRSMPRRDLIYGLLDQDKVDIASALTRIARFTDKVDDLRSDVRLLFRSSSRKRIE